MPQENILKFQARDFVVRLMDYFEREKDNGGPLLPLTTIHDRVSNELDISLRSVYKIQKKRRLLEGADERLRSPGNSRRKKTEDLSEACKSYIRDTIYHMSNIVNTLH